MSIDIEVYSKRVVTFIVIGSLLVFGPVFFFALSHYTTSSESFCMSCHRNMEDPGFWEPSKIHRPSIGCRECHGRPEMILETGFTSRDDVVSGNCLRCHGYILDKKREPGTVVQARAGGRPGAAMGKALFEWKSGELHRMHFKWSTQCVDCHRHIAHERNSAKTYLPQIEACAECHVADDFMKVYPLPVLAFDRSDRSGS